MKPLFTENIHRRLERLPALRALVPLIVGILLADVVTLPLWGVAVGFIVCAGVAIVWHKRAVADVYIVVALILVGVFALELRRSLSTHPEGVARMEILVDMLTAKRERITQGDARIMAYDVGAGVQTSRAEVRVALEPQLAIAAGDRIVVEGRITPFDKDEPYGRYMLSRGVVGQVYVGEENLLHYKTDSYAWPHRLREEAVERIRRLTLTPECEAVVLAMSVAERSGITPTLRQHYTRGGAAHLLAVSGLHVGFICVIANLLLSWLILLRHGQVMRSVGAVALIWVFAAVAGFTPSIVRAAVMFTLLQVAIGFANRSDSINTLSLTAFAMLVWDARTLHDTGFQLSFLAVAAIIEWGVPLFPQRRQGVVACIWQWIASGIVTSAVAALATLPLTAYVFGTVSLWSVVTGVVMVMLAAIVVGGAMLWILFPIGALQGVAATVIGGVTQTMNTIVAWCDSVGGLAANVSLTGWSCVAIYALMAAVTIIVWGTRRRN